MRPFTVLLGAGCLLAAALASAISRWGLQRGSPAGIAHAYLDAAAAADLDALAAVGPPGRRDEGVRTLGRAFHAHVGAKLDAALQAGALRAYQTYQTVEEAKRDARRAFWKLPYAERREVEDEDAWLADTTWALLGAGDQQLARQTDEGVRTLWEDVVDAGSGEWRKLSRWEQRREDSARFFAQHGPPRMSDAARTQLEAIGRPLLSPSQQEALAPYAFADWLDAEAFIASHGARLLAAAYAARYSSGCDGSVDVQRPPAAGLLFTPGTAQLTMTCAPSPISATARQQDGAWVLTRVADLDLLRLAAQLEATGGLH